MGTKSPLRDRVLSNSPDPVKNSILRESGLGWNSPPSAATSPLRISKRDSSCSPMRPNQPPVPRRTSSSFKHVTSNNLVSKSPFKSQIPTTRPKGPVPQSPTPRKVSGEKRPRPNSLHEQMEAENQRPFSLKRERRQSKTFQAIIHNEPVSNSPFRHLPSHAPSINATTTPASSSSLKGPLPGASPTRSSLVTRRLHGPRSSGEGKRERRKTVTFDDRMDVLEFECEEGSSLEDAVADSDEDGDEQMSNDMLDENATSLDLFNQRFPQPIFPRIELEEDTSINGLVDEMLGAAGSQQSTPPRTHDIPTDLDTEDGVPFGRTHHAQRSREYHEQQRMEPHPAPVHFSPLGNGEKEHGGHSSFPLRSPPAMSTPPFTPPSTPSHRALPTSPPLGRTSHAERIIAAQQADLDAAGGKEVQRDVDLLPPSPSGYREQLTSIPESPKAPQNDSDPFDGPKPSDDPFTPTESNSPITRPIQLSSAQQAPFTSPRRAPLPPIPLHVSSYDRSPSPSPRSRITRQEVQRRLLNKRTPTGSPYSSPSGPGSPIEETVEANSSLELSLSKSEAANIDYIPKIEPVDVATGEFGLPHPDKFDKLKIDFGSKFGRGKLGIEGLDDADSLAPSSVVEDQPVPTPSVDMDMRSALDRLMEDVGGTPADDSIITDDYSDLEEPVVSAGPSHPRAMERAATDSVLLNYNFASRPGEASMDSRPPTPPPKDNIRSREKMILEKRRQAKQLEQAEFNDHDDPSEALDVPPPSGRLNRRRSRSAGDIKDFRASTPLNLASSADGDCDLGESIQKELERRTGQQKKKYLVRQHGTIYASSRDSRDRVSHMSGPGDVNRGKVWKAVKRPSDMNEYAKQIRELRLLDKTKAHAKVFVRVLGIKGLHVPLPQQPTTVTCTLNNGVHYVTTPEIQLRRDARVDQEFELIEHSKLEFTLTLKVRRDPHIVEEFRALSAPTPVTDLVPPPIASSQSQGSSRSGMRSFFSSSPKKSKEKVDKTSAKDKPAPTPGPGLRPRLPENLARYLRPDGTLARALVTFKDVASHCDTRIFETSYPLMGQRTELNGKSSILQVGELLLQIFRLPPLPGIPPDQLPQSLEECNSGLRRAKWHKVTYFEGTLTQSGGDCTSWRRRQLRVIGSKLVAFNDVTKRVTATIDLKEAIAVEDHDESQSSQNDDDALYGVERAFRLIFPNNEEILFYADTDEEKSKWLDVLHALVGHIPPLPVWAEYLWQLQRRPNAGSSDATSSID